MLILLREEVGLRPFFDACVNVFLVGNLQRYINTDFKGTFEGYKSLPYTKSLNNE